MSDKAERRDLRLSGGGGNGGVDVSLRGFDDSNDTACAKVICHPMCERELGSGRGSGFGGFVGGRLQADVIKKRFQHIGEFTLRLGYCGRRRLQTSTSNRPK